MKNKATPRGSLRLPLFFLIFSFNISFGQQQFTEIAEQMGIAHYHRGSMGGGVAVFDYNRDGFEDIYLTGGKFGDELYKNSGQGTFIRVSNYVRLGLTRSRNTMSVTVGDVNNDGYDDVFVGTIRNERSLLYLNDGEGRFQEIGNSAGLSDLGWAMAATFLDFNLDGLLDLYIGNYVKDEGVLKDSEGNVIGFDHECFANKLYINNGDLTFTDISDLRTADHEGCALAVVASDLNADHNSDLYIANDFGEWVIPNALLVNQVDDQTFEDLSISSGMDAAIYGMGIAVGDYDRDGWVDYYVTNLGKNILFRNNANGTFTDVAENSGVSNTYFEDVFSTGWGASFLDYDQDGYEDLFVANGYIPAAEFIRNTRTDPNKLFRNNGDGTFTDVTDIHQMGSQLIARGMATGDLDQDGDLEIIVATIGETDDSGNVLIYENLYEGESKWVKVLLEGVSSNRNAIGAKTLIYSGNESFYRERLGGSSHASQNSGILHFGLGNKEKIDSLVVTWPGGENQKFYNLPINQLIRIVQSDPSYQIAGCMENSAMNFNADATHNYGCYFEVPGCTNDESAFFDPDANTDSGECTDIVTAISQPSSESFEVYPNPFRDFTIIKIKDSSEAVLRLIDLTGREIRKETIGSNTHKLQTRDIKPGIYLLSVEIDGKAQVKRVIVN